MVRSVVQHVQLESPVMLLAMQTRCVFSGPRAPTPQFCANVLRLYLEVSKSPAAQHPLNPPAHWGRLLSAIYNSQSLKNTSVLLVLASLSEARDSPRLRLAGAPSPFLERNSRFL